MAIGPVFFFSCRKGPGEMACDRQVRGVRFANGPGDVQVLRYRVQFDPEKEAKREEGREMGK